MNTLLFEDNEFIADGQSTSDDSIRYMNFKLVDADAENDRVWHKPRSSVYKMIRSTLHVHMIVLNHLGIKRNMEKSTHSEHVAEFNSKFTTDYSLVDPDIKARISYIEVSGDYDLYLSSLHASNQGAEYLRTQGSVLGAYWVTLINQAYHIQQHQLTS
jgi:hypothetical protein